MLVIYLRKTGEEGYIIEPLPLQFTTLATLHGNGGIRSAMPIGTTEPVAVTQRTTQGVLKLKLIFGMRHEAIVAPYAR